MEGHRTSHWSLPLYAFSIEPFLVLGPYRTHACCHCYWAIPTRQGQLVFSLPTSMSLSVGPTYPWLHTIPLPPPASPHCRFCAALHAHRHHILAGPPCFAVYRYLRYRCWHGMPGRGVSRWFCGTGRADRASSVLQPPPLGRGMPACRPPVAGTTCGPAYASARMRSISVALAHPMTAPTTPHACKTLG